MEVPEQVKSISGSIFLSPTSNEKVSSISMSLKNSKSCDSQDIQIKPVKYVIKFIVFILTYISKVCLERGVFAA